MQFLLIAYDATDPEAINRRLKVREEHFNKITELKKSKKFILGGAILDENGKMIGSMIVYDFPDRQSLDLKLKEEPYLNNEVWNKVEINPFRLANIE
jgi:uncharacterized protein